MVKYNNIMEQSTPNQDRARFHEDLAQILGEHVLTLADIGDFMVHYGWSEKSVKGSAYTEVFHYKTAEALAEHGVTLVEEKYRGTFILSDECIEPEKIDMAKAKIDEAKHQSDEKSRRTNERRIAEERSRQALRVKLAS
jgi:hypothetical protein